MTLTRREFVAATAASGLLIADRASSARHTGGMVSFMSAMHVDPVAGVAAYASVNAQQGYRPNPVTVFALRTIRAVNENKPLPELPPPNPPTAIRDAKELAREEGRRAGDLGRSPAGCCARPGPPGFALRSPTTIRSGSSSATS